MSAPAAALPHVDFDLYGDLPEGTTVLEASAGTGKTFTIAGLVTRYIGEGVKDEAGQEIGMDQLLVVSFSRESTRELRERVRERLVSARDGLLAVRAGRPAPDTDRLLQHLAGVPEAELVLRCERLERALALFDAATVTTTHGFCQQVLQALGTAGDHDPGAVLMEDIGDLVREVADDLYLRKWGAAGAPAPELNREEFHDLALAVCRDPATALLPDPRATPVPTGLPLTRIRIAQAVREEVERRKWRLHIIDYDDMLLRLQKLLTDPELGPTARERLRARYRIVLVDEFQDTDPTQWSILREAFHGHRTMVLIGDPKQSIYAFRGADVHSYLDAASSAGVTRTLGRSFRGDAGLMPGLDTVFRGASLGDPRIRVLPVRAVHGGRLVAVPGAPVRLRVVPRADLPQTTRGLLQTGAARTAVAQDVARYVVDLLAAGTPVRPRNGGKDRELLPGDVAVLVRTNDQARMISEELTAAGVPVVMTGRRSVFTTAAAAEWQLLLEALEQPHRITRVRRLALSCFVGMSASDLASSETATDELALRLRAWQRTLDDRGVSALFEAVGLDQGVQARVLGTEGGERMLTDLRHVSQVLHEAGVSGRLGLTALLTWLRRRSLEAGKDGGLERSRRLESDAAAVQVITVHTSKGLEFPVTLVPFAWDLHVRKPTTAVFHQAGGRRRDVGGPGSPDWGAHSLAHVQEEVDDELRLTYVALTRAQSHLVLWWAPTQNTEQSPLHRLLLHDDPETVAPPSLSVPSDAAALALFRARAAAGSGLAVEVVSPREPVRLSPSARSPELLAVARLARDLDLDWRRTSYSSLTAAAHDAPQRLGSEPEVPHRQDETDLEESPGRPADDPDHALAALPSPWEGLPAGPRFGTVVHSVLEELREADPETVRAAVAPRLRGGAAAEIGILTDGLVTALATPLGPLAGGLPHGGIAAADRLAELDFELPLAGGDEPLPMRTLLSDLVPLWRRHLPEGLLSGYADALAELEPAPLRGYLTGSIDAVLRIHAAQGPRYLVVDYKTNRLGARDEALTAWHYRGEAMERAMIDTHYPLQALLYQVALHRFLRWRQPGYAPDRHLGGVLYLFLRGMVGPGVHCADGSVPGVFSWAPPAALVVATSDLLAGSGPGGAA